jgi:hypothetical protein
LILNSYVKDLDPGQMAQKHREAVSGGDLEEALAIGSAARQSRSKFDLGLDPKLAGDDTGGIKAKDALRDLWVVREKTT